MQQRAGKHPLMGARHDRNVFMLQLRAEVVERVTLDQALSMLTQGDGQLHACRNGYSLYAESWNGVPPDVAGDSIFVDSRLCSVIRLLMSGERETDVLQVAAISETNACIESQQGIASELSTSIPFVGIEAQTYERLFT
eukprot:4678544-Amphidinium_carterae.1